MINTRGSRSAATYIVLAVSAFFVLFYQLGASPIFLWDEARVAVNSLEMMHTNNPLLVTYKGEPDLWSTKPPGAIWLFALSMKAFGIHEWSLRLPSAVAGLATVITIYAFIKYVSVSRVTALLGSLILLATVGYVGTHGTRTADFDSALVFFNTVAVLSVFLALEKHEDTGNVSAGWTYAAALSVSAAILTKGIAGVLFLPGVGAYVLARGKLLQLLKLSATWIGCGIVLVITAGFYAAREFAAPGYLSAVWLNELGGRYGGVIEGHRGPWTYYLSSFLSPNWVTWLRRPIVAEPYIASAFPWSLALPLALVAGNLSGEARCRRACLLIALCLFSYILIISFGSTKIPWYLAPTYPFTAIAVALGAGHLWTQLRNSREPTLQLIGRWLPVASVAIALLFACAIILKNVRMAEAASSLDDSEASFFVRQVFARYPRLNKVIILHDGHGSVPSIRDGIIRGSEPYTGPEQFYAIARSRRGLEARIEGSTYRAGHGDTLIRCGSVAGSALDASGQVLMEHGRCRAITIKASR
jgi:4-amino-4-deoxy-L-arabinose transferase-like glycosyltransferase